MGHTHAMVGFGAERVCVGEGSEATHGWAEKWETNTKD